MSTDESDPRADELLSAFFVRHSPGFGAAEEVSRQLASLPVSVVSDALAKSLRAATRGLPAVSGWDSLQAKQFGAVSKAIADTMGQAVVSDALAKSLRAATRGLPAVSGWDSLQAKQFGAVSKAIADTMGQAAFADGLAGALQVAKQASGFSWKIDSLLTESNVSRDELSRTLVEAELQDLIGAELTDYRDQPSEPPTAGETSQAGLEIYAALVTAVYLSALLAWWIGESNRTGENLSDVNSFSASQEAFFVIQTSRFVYLWVLAVLRKAFI